jgi:hypothetical protein
MRPMTIDKKGEREKEEEEEEAAQQFVKMQDGNYWNS